MTRDEFPDRDAIESALQRVQAGELSPAEATQMLLADFSPKANPDQPESAQPESEPPILAQPESAQPGNDEADDVAVESLASLIARLGVPPADVVETWCRQITRAAATFEQTSGQSLPAIDMTEWIMTDAGELRWTRQPVAGRAAALTSKLTTESQDQIDRFRRSLLPDQTIPPKAESTDPRQVTPVLVPNTDDAVEMKTPAATDVAAPDPGPTDAALTSRQASKRSWSRRRVVGATAVVCLAAIVAILVRHSGASKEVAGQTTSEVTLQPNRVAAVEANGSVRPSTDSLQTTERPDPSADALETFESMGDVDSEAIDAVDSMLSLDALIPDAGFLTPSTTTQDSPLAESAEPAAPNDLDPDQVSSDADTASDVNAAMNASDDESPDESPQSTRTSTVTSVQLPAVGEVGTATELWDRSVESLTLSFPTEIPFRLSGDSAGGWNILDTRGDTVVARLTTDASSTRLNWSDDAVKSTLASSLVHGRLADGAGSVIYLRPKIEADPWPIRLDKADVRPTWDLRAPIPPRVARISIEFDLPEEVEEGWIEPIEPYALRRTHAMAVLTPKDSETVALGIRFDVRCSRKLSIRVRYAARLAQMMPWQAVSSEGLLQFANQLTERAAVVSRQSTQMATLYERADTNQRRILRPKRDQLDAFAETLRAASQRAAELQAMIDTIEAEGRLSLKVWVTWPDSEQILLTTASIADEELQDQAAGAED